MARRVNTKFLVILVSFLAIAIAVIAGIWLYLNKFENNPSRLEADAAKALKAGHVTTAIKLYQRAALVLAHDGSPKLPALYTKLGFLFYNSTSVKTSRTWPMATRIRRPHQTSPRGGLIMWPP